MSLSKVANVFYLLLILIETTLLELYLNVTNSCLFFLLGCHSSSHAV